MSLQEFRDMLLTVTEHVYHFEAWQETEDEYIIWQETGGRSLYGDGARCETVKKAQVDLYTKIEFSDTLDTLLGVLEQHDIAFQEPIPSFDTDTKRFRYIIECEVI